MIRATPTATRAVTVGPLDVLHSRSRVTAAIGPVAVPEPDVVAARVRALIGSGPHTRFGLQPSSTTTRWIYDPRTTPEIVVADDPESAADLLVGTSFPAGDRRTRIVLAGDHILTDHNHGLGEVELTLRFHAVLLGVLDPTDPAVWRDTRRRCSGVGTAAARVFGSDPRRLWALRRLLGSAGVPEEPVAETRDEVPWTPSRAGAVATFEQDVFDRLRAWRDEHEPSVSMFSVTSTVLHRALTAEGIDPAPTISVPFDVRRYLPAGRTPLGNFVAGLDFPVGAYPSPRAIHDALGRAASTGRPVANLAVSSARTRVALRRGLTFAAPSTRPRSPRARILFSSLSKGPLVDRLPWLATDLPFYAAHNDPTGPEGITFTTSAFGSRVIVVASFHDTVFPADRIRAALQRAVADPLGLLATPNPQVRADVGFPGSARLPLR